jgi:membrane dipeptidase
MIVDLSHITPGCAVQELELTRAPVMFSYSNAQAVFDCPRNIPDHILDLVPKNGGVVMVNVVPEHIAKNRRAATMEDSLDHIFYISNRIGWDHIGLWSDFDGVVSDSRVGRCDVSWFTGAPVFCSVF